MPYDHRDICQWSLVLCSCMPDKRGFTLEEHGYMLEEYGVMPEEQRYIGEDCGYITQ